MYCIFVEQCNKNKLKRKQWWAEMPWVKCISTKNQHMFYFKCFFSLISQRWITFPFMKYAINLIAREAAISRSSSFGGPPKNLGTFFCSSIFDINMDVKFGNSQFRILTHVDHWSDFEGFHSDFLSVDIKVIYRIFKQIWKSLGKLHRILLTYAIYTYVISSR